MATLKNLVDETTNIKNELITCHSNLKNNLIEKGVECSYTDKMSSLIDKVKQVNAELEYMPSETVIMTTTNISATGRYLVEILKLKTDFKGCVRVSADIDSQSMVFIYHKRGDAQINYIELVGSLAVLNFSLDIENIELGDTISIKVKPSTSTYTTFINNLCVKGDVV